MEVHHLRPNEVSRQNLNDKYLSVIVIRPTPLYTTLPVQSVIILNGMACGEYYAFFHLFVQPAIENTHTERGQVVSRVNPESLLYIFPMQWKPMNQLFYLRGQYL